MTNESNKSGTYGVTRRVFNKSVAAGATALATGDVPKAAGLLKTSADEAHAIPFIAPALKAAVAKASELFPRLLGYSPCIKNKDTLQDFQIRLKEHLLEVCKNIDDLADCMDVINQSPQAHSYINAYVTDYRKIYDPFVNYNDEGFMGIIDRWISSRQPEAAKTKMIEQIDGCAKDHIHKINNGRMDFKTTVATINAIKQKPAIERNWDEVVYLHYLAHEIGLNHTSQPEAKAFLYSRCDKIDAYQKGERELDKAYGVSLQPWVHHPTWLAYKPKRELGIQLSLQQNPRTVRASFDQYASQLFDELMNLTQQLASMPRSPDKKVIEELPDFLEKEWPGMIEDVKHQAALQKGKTPERKAKGKHTKKIVDETEWPGVGGRGNDIY